MTMVEVVVSALQVSLCINLMKILKIYKGFTRVIPFQFLKTNLGTLVPVQISVCRWVLSAEEDGVSVLLLERKEDNLVVRPNSSPARHKRFSQLELSSQTSTKRSLKTVMLCFNVCKRL